MILTFVTLFPLSIFGTHYSEIVLDLSGTHYSGIVSSFGNLLLNLRRNLHLTRRSPS